MKKITQIEFIEERKQDKKVYYRIHAILDEQEEGVAYATKPDEYKVGDMVEFFFDDKWNIAKFRHKPVHKPMDNN